MRELAALTCLVQLGVLMSATDCAPTVSSTVTPQSIGETFSIGVGESASVAGANLSLTFTAVTKDSRCPKDATCIVAGEAVVLFEARAKGERADLTFEVPPGGGDAKELADLTITIVELDPPTESGKPIEPSSYIAMVVVAVGR